MKGLALIGITLLCTGCAGLMAESLGSGDKGRILISADAEGMESFGHVLHGSKEPESPYWPYQHEREVTKRTKYSSYGKKPRSK